MTTVSFLGMPHKAMWGVFTFLDSRDHVICGLISKDFFNVEYERSLNTRKITVYDSPRDEYFSYVRRLCLYFSNVRKLKPKFIEIAPKTIGEAFAGIKDLLLLDDSLRPEVLFQGKQQMCTSGLRLLLEVEACDGYLAKFIPEVIKSCNISDHLLEHFLDKTLPLSDCQERNRYLTLAIQEQKPLSILLLVLKHVHVLDVGVLDGALANYGAFLPLKDFLDKASHITHGDIREVIRKQCPIEMFQALFCRLSAEEKLCIDGSVLELAIKHDHSNEVLLQLIPLFSELEEKHLFSYCCLRQAPVSESIVNLLLDRVPHPLIAEYPLRSEFSHITNERFQRQPDQALQIEHRKSAKFTTRGIKLPITSKDIQKLASPTIGNLLKRSPRKDKEK
jgi:hypothetical protein